MKFLKKTLRALVSPLLCMVVFSLVGAALIVFGIYFLAGVGWASISAGLFLLAFAWLVARGLSVSG